VNMRKSILAVVIFGLFALAIYLLSECHAGGGGGEQAPMDAAAGIDG